MKSIVRNILNTKTQPDNINISLLILRISAGTFMLTHGWGKMIKLFGDDPITFSDPLGVGVEVSLFLAVFSEAFCSVLLIFGLFTRLAILPLLITMMVAAFISHAGDGFAKQELALFYGVVYLVITILGAGKFSIDNRIYQKSKAK